MTLENWKTDYEKAREEHPEYYAMLDKLDAMQKQYEQALASGDYDTVKNLSVRLGLEVPPEPKKMSFREAVEETLEWDNENKLEQRRQKRLSRCGFWFSYIDIMTGRLVRARFDCNQYDVCEKCRERKAATEMAFLQFINPEELFVYTMSDKDWTYNTRKVDSHEYRRIKQDDGMIIVISDNPGLRCQEVSRGIDKNKMTDIIEHKDLRSKITGKLGHLEEKPELPDPLEGVPVYDVVAVTSDASAKQQKEAYRLTIEELLGQNERPAIETEEDVQAFLDSITETYSQYINLQGAQVKATFKLRRRIQKSLIDLERIYRHFCIDDDNELYLDGCYNGPQHIFLQNLEDSIPEFG